MFRGLVAAGRPILLSVEGQPDVRVITKGGYGNSKRVGHDITSSWTSMTSLVDIGSGIWPYAHNSTDPAYGGWFSDLDMLVSAQCACCSGSVWVVLHGALHRTRCARLAGGWAR